MSDTRRPYNDILEPSLLLPLLLENIKDYGLIVLDEAGNVLEWSTGAAEIFGYSREEMLMKFPDILMVEEDRLRGQFVKELESAREVGRADDTRWHKRKDGKQIFIQGTTSALKDSSGVLKGFAKVVRDLTRQRTAEDALGESEERFRVMVEKIKEYAVFTLDPKGNISSWNLGAQRIKQYRAEEVLGRFFGMLYLPEEQKAGRPEYNLKEALRKGTHDDKGPRVRKDGTVFIADASITAIFDRERVHLGFTKVVRDATELEEHEKARVAAEESLRKYAAEIESLNERLRRWITETHHRVKNNMQVVMALIDYQTVGKKEFVHIEELKRLKHHIQTLAAVHDTLAHGANNEDELELVSGRPLLEKLIKLLERSSGGKLLHYEVEECLFRTKEITALCLIINELVSNAVKYGHQNIYITLRFLDGEGVLTVEDDGPGFTEGFDIEKAANIGLELVQSVVTSDLKGKLELSRSEYGGARVTIRATKVGE